ncbi:MAG TPA: ATP-binding protein [Rhodopila sp.]|uniref:ATP-binding protein n=1 Tax=Rhodopila sp. TaxID=2480087 RepID=UPI002C9C827B|nr:ATP-binding protein [Rhodopila sp.]HVY17270.1 ATP-binding protein [Rhodopila sp.]
MIALDPELRLTPALADLARVYPWLDQVAAGSPAAVLSRMHVALEEAVANAALHGFPGGSDGHIVLRALRRGDLMVLEVEDDGIPFDPTQAAVRARASRLEEAEPGGWGLGLIRAFTTSIGYERRGGRNVLRLGFFLTGGAMTGGTIA